MTDPKYQVSQFPNGDKGTQWVVRADTFEEIQKMKEEMESLFGAQMPLAAPVAPVKHFETANEKLARQSMDEPETTTFSGNDAIITKPCTKCGQLATKRSGISKKTGKPWSAFFCSSDDKTHTEFV